MIYAPVPQEIPVQFCTSDINISMQTKVSRFKSESDLVKGLVDILKQQPQLTNSYVINEFESPNGVADLVIVDLFPEWRKRLNIGKIRPEWSYALYKLISKKSFSLEDFQIFTGVSSRRAKKALCDFSIAGYCQQTAVDKHWKKTVQVKPVATNICAIEAKLSDWKRALYQATRYQDFANQSWVVMDEKNIATARKNIEQFRRLNVGLAGVDVLGSLYVHHIPNSCPSRSEARYWYANAQVAASLLESVTPGCDNKSE